MSDTLINISLCENDFAQLCKGGKITLIRSNCEINIALQDIGFNVMFDCVDQAMIQHKKDLADKLHNNKFAKLAKALAKDMNVDPEDLDDDLLIQLAKKIEEETTPSQQEEDIPK